MIRDLLLGASRYGADAWRAYRDPAMLTQAHADALQQAQDAAGVRLTIVQRGWFMGRFVCGWWNARTGRV
jgi:CubicO group peptidase (beta-lactamase class C family)